MSKKKYKRQPMADQNGPVMFKENGQQKKHEQKRQ